MRSLKIGNIIIDDQSDAFVIAEIGHNHQGDLEICKQIFRVAKECGATAVKLQKRHNKALFTKHFYNQPYNSENAYGPTYGLHREALEFNEAQYRELKDYANDLGLLFFATAFDFSSVDFLEKLDVPCYKVASGDLTNIPLLKYIAQTGRPMIVSTGASSIDDVRRAYAAIRPINQNFAFLQCTATYPSKFDELNIRVLETYRQEFPDTVVGLSGHDSGIAMAVLGYALGGRIFEKHFTLNRANRGTDHAFSLEPQGLEKMIRDLRRSRVALGDGLKRMFENEQPALKKMGKKIVAARDLPAGHVIQDGDLAFKSPGDGLFPYHADTFYGKSLKTAVAEDDDLTFDHI